MEKNRHGGFFIAFEGLDGAGSTTQAVLLAQHLQKSGFAVLETKEPTINLIGGLIRGQLTGEWSSGQECLQLLFAADRAHHLEREIIPALKTNRIVISDRYLFSSMAFGSLGADFEWLKQINGRFIRPDLTILLKVAPETCLRRITRSRFEIQLFEELSRMRKVWRTYQSIKRDYGGIVEVDAERSTEETSREIVQTVEDRLHTIRKRLRRRR